MTKHRERPRLIYNKLKTDDIVGSCNVSKNCQQSQETGYGAMIPPFFITTENVYFSDVCCQEVIEDGTPKATCFN